MVVNAASAIIARLRSRNPRPRLAAGVYYLRGTNQWVYVPAHAQVVRGQPGLDGPEDAFDPHWQVRTVVVDPAIAHDASAAAYLALHSPRDLRPATDLRVATDLLERIRRRAQRLLDGIATG